MSQPFVVAVGALRERRQLDGGRVTVVRLDGQAQLGTQLVDVRLATSGQYLRLELVEHTHADVQVSLRLRRLVQPRPRQLGRRRRSRTRRRPVVL